MIIDNKTRIMYCIQYFIVTVELNEIVSFTIYINMNHGNVGFDSSIQWSVQEIAGMSVRRECMDVIKEGSHGCH